MITFIETDKMTIEGFGNIEYNRRDKKWVGLVSSLAPNNRVELAISADDFSRDIGKNIESVRLFASDYDAIMASLYELACQKYRNSRWEKL